MKRDKFDKSIICNDNLDAPSKDVLYAAKAEMRKNHVERKKLSPSKILAIASACVAVVVLLCCIPLMMESINRQNYADYAKFPSTGNMTKTEISSIEDFNKENDRNMLMFDGAVQSSAYVYSEKDTDRYCQMLYTYGDTQIEVWVKLRADESNGALSGEDPDFSSDIHRGIKVDEIKGHIVEYIVDSNSRVFTKFKYLGYIYMIEMQGEISDWKNILENFIK